MPPVPEKHDVAATQETCSDLHQARLKFKGFLAAAIEVVPDQAVDPLPGSSAQRILRFEIIHSDSAYRIAMADACVVITAKDPSVRFVAPTSSEKPNYVSYWHRPAEVIPGQPTWQPMSDGAVTQTAPALDRTSAVGRHFRP